MLYSNFEKQHTNSKTNYQLFTEANFYKTFSSKFVNFTTF